MGTLLDDLLDFATHPSVAPHLANTLVGWTAPKRDFQAEMTQRLDEISAQLASKKKGGRKPKYQAAVTANTTGETITSLADVRDHTVKLAATLKEAARFARSNPDHPDAIQRLNDARRMADELTEAERYVLAPERVPDGQRKAVEAVLPLIRTTRELTLNSLGSVDGISDAAAAAGNAATALQVAVATGSVPTLPHTEDSLYGRAAKTESGCVECGRAHLAAVAATLRRAAKDSTEKGWAHPDVQSRLAFAQEELAALTAYDWTPDKISKNPHTEQQVLRTYVVEVDKLHNSLKTVTDPASLSQLAEHATTLREGFEHALPQKFNMITLTGRNSDAGVDLSKLELFGLPTAAQVQEITEPQSAARYFNELRVKLRERGVKVVYRQPHYESPGIIIEGEYNPATNQVSLNPAALDIEDPYHLQVLIHEGVHSLLHNKQCLPVSVITPEVRNRAEEETELTVIAAMTELGMPIEDRDGNQVLPTKRGVDWELLRRNVAPEVYEDVRAATEWVVAAAQGADGDLGAWTCPALRSVTVKPTIEWVVTPSKVSIEPGPLTVFHLTDNQKQRIAQAALNAYRQRPGARAQQYSVGGYTVRVAPVSGGIGVGIISENGEYERVMTVKQSDESLAEPEEPEVEEDFQRTTTTTPDMKFNSVAWRVFQDPLDPNEYDVGWINPRTGAAGEILEGVSLEQAKRFQDLMEHTQHDVLAELDNGLSISQLTEFERSSISGNRTPPTYRGVFAIPPSAPNISKTKGKSKSLHYEVPFRRVIVCPTIEGGTPRG